MKRTFTSFCLAALALPVLASEVETMDKLRVRLAEKMSSVKGPGSGDAMALRVSASVSPTASPAATQPVAIKPPAASVAPKRRAPSAAGAGAGHWSYAGEAGPQTWGGLKPEFATCSSGQRQSPIDIRDGIAVDLEPVTFDYRPSRFAVVDNGQTVQVNVAPGNAIELGGRRFELKQFHFHRPSEERIDGRQFEMSAHFVHADSDGRLAVVGVLLAKGPAHPLVQTVWAHLPLEKHSEQRARVLLDPSQLLPIDRRYFTYMGSLTTPPCSEGVQWVVMRHAVEASPDQIEIFSRLYPMNARPPQSAAGRRIMQSN